MEFSILIPVYNTHIKDLAEDLWLQANEISDNFQILFIDDCSQLSISYINQKVRLKEHIDYIVLHENIGRAAIRNKLFKEAKYDKCIVLDGDVSMIKDDFIYTYLQFLNEENIVVGGHEYHEKPPEDAAKYLHWLYGSKVESKAQSERSKHPYHSFMTSNFACSKQIFSQLKFDENLSGYGHEDTLFGIQAKQESIPILHIDNPVTHEGIDTVSDFLNKQKNAVKNLKKLTQNKVIQREIVNSSKLAKWGNTPILPSFLTIFEKTIQKKLHSKTPSLFALQLQKLIWWNKN